jgi:hypothetical protein
MMPPGLICNASVAHQLIRPKHPWRALLAKRIIGMAHRDDMRQVAQLRDDALAHLENNPFFKNFTGHR